MTTLVDEAQKAKDPDGQSLPIDAIVVDLDLQPRTGGIDGEHVRALEESVEDWPPLSVVERAGRFVLVDGFHRLAAAQNLALDTVDVRVFPTPTDRDLRGLAFALNARHGRPLTLTDRREEAARLLVLVPTSSDREIGRRCGLSQPTVAKVRGALEAGAQIERTPTRVGRGGYTYAVQDAPATMTEEQEQRRLASHLYRLATMLERSHDYAAFPDAEAVVAALCAVYEDDDAVEIVDMLAEGARELVDLATACGWEAGSEET